METSKSTETEVLKQYEQQLYQDMQLTFVREADRPAMAKLLWDAEQSKEEFRSNNLLNNILNALFEDGNTSIEDVVLFLWQRHPATMLNKLYDIMTNHGKLDSQLIGILDICANYKADPKTLHNWKWCWECRTCDYSWFAPRAWRGTCPKCTSSNVFKLEYIEAREGSIANESYYANARKKIAATTAEVGF